jgi:hypothetical protein
VAEIVVDEAVGAWLRSTKKVLDVAEARNSNTRPGGRV